MNSKSSEDVELKFTKDEALVLFEFMSRFTESDKLEIIDQAEQRALWNFTAILETVLAEPFSNDYNEIVKAARNRLRDNL